MRLPDKVTAYGESVFPSLIQVGLLIRRNQHIRVSDVCRSVNGIGVADCFQALDALFALGMIELDSQKEDIRYVD